MFCKGLCAFATPVRRALDLYATAIIGQDRGIWEYQETFFFRYRPDEREGEVPLIIKEILWEMAENNYLKKVSEHVQQDTPDLLAYDLVDQED